MNWNIDFDASEITAVILTHAHIDHSGWLPKLAANGFTGPIYCSKATAELCDFMLRDAAKLQEEDAIYANESGYSHHKPAHPLYTVKDVEKVIRLFKVVSDHEWFTFGEQLQFRFFRAGHILGSRFVQIAFPVTDGVRTILFSGDLGNGRSLLVRQPEDIVDTDYLVIESTYGNRLLPHEHCIDELGKILIKVLARGGMALIPAFAVGRTQDMLHAIWHLQKTNVIPDNIPVFVDSPMGRQATRAHLRHEDELVPMDDGDDIRGPLNTERFKCTGSVEESKGLLSVKAPHILISSSGMLTGGRVMHHLKKRLSDKRNAIIFVGYQAEETKGRVLLSGSPTLRVHHEEFPVLAEVAQVKGFSAHADYQDSLKWMSGLKVAPKKIFINHGEHEAQLFFKDKILEKFPDTEVIIPAQGDEFKLG